MQSYNLKFEKQDRNAILPFKFCKVGYQCMATIQNGRITLISYVEHWVRACTTTLKQENNVILSRKSMQSYRETQCDSIKRYQCDPIEIRI